MKAIIDDFIAPVCKAQIEILFQDEDILIINKPSGLLSLSGKNPLNKDSVHYRLRQQFPDCLMVHRLDLGTSGLMVVALNKAANAHLNKQFQNREVKKTYIAVLDGHLKEAAGFIQAAIAKDPPNFPRMQICLDTGKPAVSQYQVLEMLQAPARTRVLFTPETGRTHQLRIHSLEIGHAILGCDLYGDERTLKLAPRLLLHAFSLSFQHPVSAEALSFECECSF
ncbi:MAG: RluA family pseudouridine synthase [Pseudomonadales bacterium]|nr:RluA family pseudouridine synthase [Pseudomonadales bacterium]